MPGFTDICWCLGRTNQFERGHKIIGGFLNTHTSFNQRNPGTNVTIIKSVRNYATNLTHATLLDGFMFTGSKSGRAVPYTMKMPVRLITNCIFSGNEGG